MAADSLLLFDESGREASLSNFNHWANSSFARDTLADSVHRETQRWQFLRKSTEILSSRALLLGAYQILVRLDSKSHE